MNKKLLLNTFVFQMVGAIVFVITFLLTFFGVISKNNTLVNGMIFAVSAMLVFHGMHLLPISIAIQLTSRIVYC